MKISRRICPSDGGAFFLSLLLQKKYQMVVGSTGTTNRWQENHYSMRFFQLMIFEIHTHTSVRFIMPELPEFGRFWKIYLTMGYHFR
jgi:hypothetical protein